MKKVLLSAVLAVVMLVSGCSKGNTTGQEYASNDVSPVIIESAESESESVAEISVTQLYADVFKPFCDGMDTLTFEKAKSLARSLDYAMEITDEEGTFTVSAEDGDKITADFCWDMNEKNTLYQLMYERGDRYIYASSLAHIQEVHYYTHDAYGENSVTSLADCEEFLFGSAITQEKSYEVKLLHGELLEKRAIGTSLTIKAKIEPSYNNKATIDQNYYNIENIIKKQGGTRFTLIDYWAVADMTDGSEKKVISFTLSEDVINKIANNQIAANTLGDYVDDLYILPSLQE